MSPAPLRRPHSCSARLLWSLSLRDHIPLLCPARAPPGSAAPWGGSHLRCRAPFGPGLLWGERALGRLGRHWTSCRLRNGAVCWDTLSWGMWTSFVSREGSGEGSFQGPVCSCAQSLCGADRRLSKEGLLPCPSQLMRSALHPELGVSQQPQAAECWALLATSPEGLLATGLRLCLGVLLSSSPVGPPARVTLPEWAARGVSIPSPDVGCTAALAPRPPGL